jgi:serine/threonine-protein kinase
MPAAEKITLSGGVGVMLNDAVDDSLFPGRVISERFRLERLLGRGGMGTVWQARHLSLDTQIAIKFLNAELSKRQDIRSRFAREASSVARIRSPNVVGVLDSGFTDDGYAFIAMELLHGEDLGRRLAREGRCTVRETSSLVTQVARGLSKAHAVGIVHRDLKPENLFVLSDDDGFVVKILDFGIAKAVGPGAASHQTDTGQLLGTPTYMSPEQAMGRPLDRRSDLYSLAVVAYRCLAGRPPFAHSAPGELIVAVSTRTPPIPSSFNPDLPAVFDTWFERALAKDPDDRGWQTASELAESFERVCAEANDIPVVRRPRHVTPRGVHLPGATLSDPPPPVSPEESATTEIAGSPTVPQRRAPRWRLVAPAVALLGTVVALAARGQRVAPPEAAAKTNVHVTAQQPEPDVALPPPSAADTAPVPSASAQPKFVAVRTPSTAPRLRKADSALPSEPAVVASEAPPVPESSSQIAATATTGASERPALDIDRDPL